jgi:hypothetical protein
MSQGFVYLILRFCCLDFARGVCWALCPAVLDDISS